MKQLIIYNSIDDEFEGGVWPCERERVCVKIMITRLKSKKFKIVNGILGPHVMAGSVRIIDKWLNSQFLTN